MLETAPSLSVYSKNTEEGEENRENGLGDEDANLIRSVTIGDQIDESVLGSGDFSFVKSNIDLIKEDGEDFGGLEKLGTEEAQPPSPPMYLAAGLEIRDGTEGFGLNRENSEEYLEVLEEYPNHPLVLRNYAEFLQNKGDLKGAECCYFRATQADPSDAEVMSRYATLVWELHHDREKALTCFEHATQTAPDDSNVLAAFAKFLWEIDDEEQDKCADPNYVQIHDKQKIFHSDLQPSQGIEVSTDSLEGGNTCLALGGGGPNESAYVENYYRRMIQENPSDPRFLKGYVQFLYQSKGDLQGAEEYYLQAILADPQDGELLSHFAKLVWELYQDQDRALVYFERAIQAAPQDSNVLAAYAFFLWTIDDDDIVDKQLDSLPQEVLAGCAGA